MEFAENTNYTCLMYLYGKYVVKTMAAEVVNQIMFITKMLIRETNKMSIAR